MSTGVPLVHANLAPIYEPCFKLLNILCCLVPARTSEAFLILQKTCSISEVPDLPELNKKNEISGPPER